MMNNKQELARSRNWLKFQLSNKGIYTKHKYLTPFEIKTINVINNKIKKLIQTFDSNSREMGLKVPRYKCWCGKEGKYDPEYEVYGDCIKVCKNHIKTTN